MSMIGMLLGIEPIPEPKAKGRTHLADGRAETVHKRTDRIEAIAARWDAIKAICSHEPCTRKELLEATGFKEGTLADDLNKMVEKGLIRKRVHRQEWIYWVAA